MKVMRGDQKMAEVSVVRDVPDFSISAASITPRAAGSRCQTLILAVSKL